MEKIKISFDFDYTLSRMVIQDYARELQERGFEIHITTTRTKSWKSHSFFDKDFWNEDLYKIANELNIPDNHIIFTDGVDKFKFIEDENFLIHFDDDYTELDLINQYTETIGLSVWKTSCWKKKSEIIIKKHRALFEKKANEILLLAQGQKDIIKKLCKTIEQKECAWKQEKLYNQKLVDVCFHLVLTSTSEKNKEYFYTKTEEEKAEWVRDQLRYSGFNTHAVGASWGILDKE